MEIGKLDYEFINEYTFWLKSVRNCNQNNTTKYLTKFKKAILLCVKSGWFGRDPFMNFQLVRKEMESTKSGAKRKTLSDFEKPELQRKVDADLESGVRSSVIGTPSLSINGDKHKGSWEEEDFLAYL